MGYTTNFLGTFTFNRPLDTETFEFLTKLANTRRMKRKLGPEYGVEGEFYVQGKGYMGQDATDRNIVNYNVPPSTQPSLWLQWIPTLDRTALVWDGVEKFYYAGEWIKYLVERVLAPRGYVLNGVVNARGEDSRDIWYIEIIDNQINVVKGRFHSGADRVPLLYDNENDDEQ